MRLLSRVFSPGTDLSYLQVLERRADAIRDRGASVATERRDASTTTEQHDSSVTTERRDSSATTERHDSSVTTERHDASVTTEPSGAAVSGQEHDSSAELHAHVLLRTRTWPVEHEIRTMLAGAGVELLRYVPDETWLARVHLEHFDPVRVRQALSWIGPIRSEDKLSPRLAETRWGRWCETPEGMLRVRVRVHEGLDPAHVARELTRLLRDPQSGTSLQIETIDPSGRGLRVRVHPASLQELASVESIQWISEALPPATPENDQSRDVVGAESLQVAPYSLGGTGIRVGVSDTGSADAHPDFDARVINMDAAPIDGHATHVTGTLIGSGLQSETEGGGPLQWRGMAPVAEAFVFERTDFLTDLYTGIPAYALDLINGSWGFVVDASNCELYGDYAFLAPELDALVRGAADGRRVPIVFSAGNERNDGDCELVAGGYGCINPPKAAKNVLVIGATYSDSDGMTEFSSWGPVDDGRLKPDLVAPGCEDGGEGYIRSTLPGGGYGSILFCGTSMAAPATSGCLALLMELSARDSSGATPDPLEPSLFKALLAATAVDLGMPGPDYAFGHGRLDALAAARVVQDDSPLSFTLDQDEAWSAGVPVFEPTDLRLVLAWDDPAAVPMAATALVNDLDLFAVSPAGDTLRPWVLDPVVPDLPAARGFDRRDNVEHLTVLGAEPGLWTVGVYGHSVPEGPQIASLVGLDIRPPATPEDLVAEADGPGEAELRWQNPGSGDWRGSLVVRIDPPGGWTGPVDGQLYAPGIVSPGVEILHAGPGDFETDAFPDGGLVPGDLYLYEVYAFDDMANYSAAAVDSLPLPGPSGLEPPPVPAELRLRVSPNPVVPERGMARLSFVVELPRAGRPIFRVYDVSGRTRARSNGQWLEAGRHRISLDLESLGAPAGPWPAGTYWMEMALGDARAVATFRWIR